MGPERGSVSTSYVAWQTSIPFRAMGRRQTPALCSTDSQATTPAEHIHAHSPPSSRPMPVAHPGWHWQAAMTRASPAVCPKRTAPTSVTLGRRPRTRDATIETRVLQPPRSLRRPECSPLARFGRYRRGCKPSARTIPQDIRHAQRNTLASSNTVSHGKFVARQPILWTTTT